MTLLDRAARLFASAPAVASASMPLPGGVASVEVASPWSPDPSHLGHLGAVVYGDVFGRSDLDLIPMSRAEAMSIPVVRRARNLVCATLARLPIYCTGPAGDRRTDVPWLAKFDPAVTRASQVSWTADDLLFYDVSYALVLARGFDRRPLAFRRVEPHRVQVPLRVGEPYKVDGVEIPWQDVIRTDGLAGGGILATSSRSLRISTRLEAAAARVADNPVPAVELHQEDGPDLTEDEIDALTDRWVESRKRGHGVGYTSRHVRAIAHGAPAEHLLIEGRGRQDTDTARIMGVPADMVDAQSGASMTYANMADRAEALIDYGLANIAAAMEARWSDDDLVPHGSSVGFDFTALTVAEAAADTSTPAPAAPAPAPTSGVPA